MSLSRKDQAQLTRILSLAFELEHSWPIRDRHETRPLADDSRYQELKAEILSCQNAQAESLRRLAESAHHLHDNVSLAHFYGCLVPFERLAGRSLRDDEFLVQEGDRQERALEPLPLKLIVENLRSAFNVGALFRTSECLGVSEIWLCGYTPGPDDSKTKHTAMGTSSLVPWRRVDRARTACQELRQQGYQILALETAASAVSLNDMQFSRKPTAFILGNERFGIEDETLREADHICQIPLRGIKNSLNVGVAFGIAGFEFLRQYELLR